MRRGGEQYANQTLSDLVDLLTAAARTAENGRRALADRVAAADAAAGGEQEQAQMSGEWAQDDPESLDAPDRLDAPEEQNSDGPAGPDAADAEPHGR